MDSLQFIVLLICASQIFLNVNGLMCSQCLAINCEDENLECQRTRSFIELELKSMYYFEGSLETCPTTEYQWTKMRTNTLEHCPEDKPGDATCASGRIQVTTTRIAPDGGNNATTTNYATSVGCAKRNLMQNIKSQYDQAKPCYIYNNMLETEETRESKVVRMLEVEHCRDVDKLCHEKDFCLDKSQSTIRYWMNRMRNERRKGFFVSFIYSYGIYILGGFALVVLIAIAVGTFCGNCNKSSSGEEEVPPSTTENGKVGKDAKIIKQAIAVTVDGKEIEANVPYENNVNINVEEPEKIESRFEPPVDGQIHKRMSNEYNVNVREIKNRFETADNGQMSNGNIVNGRHNMTVFKSEHSAVV